MNEIQILQRKVEELERFIVSLQASHSIPLNVDRALRTRLSLGESGSGNSLVVSGKSSSSENVAQSVNEAGAATYTINYVNQYDGFLQITIGATIYYLPYYL